MKNSIATQGYFIKRLRDSGFVVVKIFDKYPQHDARKWTVMVDPENTSTMITCYQNKNYKGDLYFEFDDGGNRFLKNYKLSTQSMEIIITNLIERKVCQISEKSSFFKKD